MRYLKQILHQTEQVFVTEVIVDHSLTYNIYKICTKYRNDTFLAADENIAKLLNKNIFNKISHLIIPSNTIV